MKHSAGPRRGIPRSSVFATAVLLVLVVASNLQAQGYRFQVQQMDLEVFLQPDASARLDYKIVFQNAPDGRPIDIVDIGLPHAGYSIATMQAFLDGNPLGGIQRSTYIDVGVEVPLGRYAIPPGQSGTLTFRCTMPNMVYEDLTDANYASFQIKPTWFDPSLQIGTTDLRIGIHLPEGVQADEVRYQNERLRYHDLALVGDEAAPRVLAFWHFPATRLSESNPRVAVSFPRRVMTRVVSMSRWELLVNWFAGSSTAQWVSGTLLVLLFLVTYLRFSHGTGLVLALIGTVLLVFIFVNSPRLHLLLWLPMPILFGLNEYALRRRRSKYLPAMATVEGGGIKRGLTAPQAAVVLEMPLGQVLTLVLFGLLKKGVIRQVREDKIQFEVVREFRKARESRLKAAERAGIVIHDYENPFIDRLLANKPVEEINFNEALGKLIKSTAARMEGFDLSDTREYYRRIIQRAWKEAESIHDVEKKTQTVDRHFEWMMLDPEWHRRFTTWHERGYDYRPRWSRPIITSSDGGSRGPSTASPAPTSSTWQTSDSEVAASFVGWAENTSGRLASTIEPAKLGLSIPKGIVNLTAVDTVTGEVLEALAKNSGGRRSGGGGGCACACAGCACACACAGGGR